MLRFGDAKLHDGAAIVVEDDLFSGGGGEIEDKVGAFGGGEGDALEFDGRGEQALVGADLLEGLSVGEREMEEAGVGAINDAEAIEARLDFEIGENFAVDEEGVAKDFGGPGRFGIAGDGIVELAVEIEDAVVEDEGNFVLAARKI